jgi:hypothetical protein
VYGELQAAELQRPSVRGRYLAPTTPKGGLLRSELQPDRVARCRAIDLHMDQSDRGDASEAKTPLQGLQAKTERIHDLPDDAAAPEQLDQDQHRADGPVPPGGRLVHAQGQRLPRVRQSDRGPRSVLRRSHENVDADDRGCQQPEPEHDGPSASDQREQLIERERAACGGAFRQLIGDRDGVVG